MKQLIYSFEFFAALLLTISFAAHAQIITTVAGSNNIYLGDDGQATDAKLVHPIGIVFDAAGNYYITDRDESLIRKVATDGIITVFAGDTTSFGFGFSGDGGPATAAKLYLPYGIAIDTAGNIYFVDYGNNRVRKINTAGVISTIAGNGGMGYNGDNIPATAAELNVPGGVAVDNAGNVYVTDDYNNRIRKVNASGIITTIAGTGVGGYNGDGIPATGAEVNNPVYIAVDKTGNIYIADVDNDRIRKIDTTGIITTYAGNGVAGYSGDNGAATAAKIWGAIGIYPDNLGNVYIGDTYNNVVRKVSAAGIITTIAGNGVEGYSGDGGEAMLAELFWPAGIATDTAYNLYIVDLGNNRVRRISSTVFVQMASVKNELQVYPNPSDGYFEVNVLSDMNEKATVTITDITGQFVKEMYVMTNTLFNVQILDAPPGMYLLYAKTSSGMLMEKIVKTK